MASKLIVTPKRGKSWGRVGAKLRPRSRRAVVKYRSPRLHPFAASLLERGADAAGSRRIGPVRARTKRSKAKLFALVGLAAAAVAGIATRKGGGGQPETFEGFSSPQAVPQPDTSEGVGQNGEVTTPAGETSLRPAG